MALSDAKIRNAKPKAHRYRLADGHGLSLEISPSGNRFWRYRAAGSAGACDWANISECL
jgi:hypothetical protein